MTEMYVAGGELYSATDEQLVSAIPSNAKWNWVGWHHLSNTHRVIKNDLVEEHFFYNNRWFYKSLFQSSLCY